MKYFNRSRIKTCGLGVDIHIECEFYRSRGNGDFVVYSFVCAWKRP